MTVEASNEEGAAFLYSWDDSGSHDDNSDLYFKVSKDGKIYTFTVESYLCDNTTNVYTTVEKLQVGDVIDMEGFLYWYEGANPHITAVSHTVPPTIVLPDGIVTVEEESFYGVAAQTVIITSGCKTIGPAAFAESSLCSAHIPSSVMMISDDSFPAGITIYTPQGSYAEHWGHEHGYTVVEQR